MSNKIIAIMTVENDLHALAVKDALARRSDITCHIVETNRICDSSGFTWTVKPGDPFECTVPTRDGVSLPIRSLDLIWWRRFNVQKVPPQITDTCHIDLINNDCASALGGALVTEFQGVWVNEPRATRAAENKVIQLRAAQQVGFRVPRTLISNDIDSVRMFCDLLKGNVVVKSVRGTIQGPTFTQPLAEEHLDPDSLRLCPAIFQERIPGSHHLRVHCFGDEILAARIESEALDWRGNLDVPFVKYDVPDNLRELLRAVLGCLDLRMGIVDLKLDRDGSPVWLEINPQGQFLFVEGIAGIQLTTAFANFLHVEASLNGSHSRPSPVPSTSSV